MTEERCQRIHLIGICGTGMAALATLLKDLGHKVSGSDSNIYPPMNVMLERAGIHVLPFGVDNLEGADHIVLGAGVPSRNVEASAAIERGLSILSYPEALERYVLADREVHLVAGTHGKTTTSAMLAFIHEAAGNEPGFVIGGAPLNFESGARLPRRRIVVGEGDEYKSSALDLAPKFLKYRPHLLAITNVEFDHADVFADAEAVIGAFAALVRMVDEEGAIVATANGSVVEVLRQAARCPFVTVGRGLDADWRILERKIGYERQVEVVARHGNARIGPFALRVAGSHNADNAALAAVAAMRAGIDGETIARALANFLGVRRRLEILVDGKLRVIDDFAHHPTAVAASITALRQQDGGRHIWAIFEPRSATSKTPLFQERYRDALSLADRVFILEVPNRPDGQATLDTQALAQAIEYRGVPAQSLATFEEIFAAVEADLVSDLDLLVMSHGPFGGLAGKLRDLILGFGPPEDASVPSGSRHRAHPSSVQR